jgi:anion-transporting  ArsA/GET3 family ATPase
MGFDHIIIDSYSTGHHKALLKAPQAMAQTVHHGPMGFHSEKIFEVIRNPQQTDHFIVLKPEDLPTAEGLELYQFLKKEWAIDSKLVVNQYMEYPLNTSEMETISAKSSSPPLRDLSRYFAQLSHEQDMCTEEVRENKKDFLFTPFVFKKENTHQFLIQILEGFRQA